METDLATPAEQTPAEGGPASAPDIDSVIAQYLDSAGEESEPATPAAEERPQPEAEDTPVDQQDPEAEELDTPAEEDEGEDTGDELEEEEQDEAPEGDDEIDALLAETAEDPKDTPEPESFLPEFDRAKFLKEHPELEAPYKHLQSAFTKKMTEVSKVQKQADQVRSEAEAMQQQLLAFQERLKSDDSFEEFLVQVSLNRPEVMERAYERAVALTEDEGKKKEYLQERELAETKAKLKEREERDVQTRQRERVQEVVGLTQRVAAKLGLSGPGDMEVAEQYVANQILQNHADNGKRDISNEEIVLAVRRAAKALAREKESARKAGKQEVRQETLRAAKERARSPRRPPPPRAAAPSATPAEPKRVNHRPPTDPLADFIDTQLGVEE